MRPPSAPNALSGSAHDFPAAFRVPRDAGVGDGGAVAGTGPAYALARLICAAVAGWTLAVLALGLVPPTAAPLLAALDAVALAGLLAVLRAERRRTRAALQSSELRLQAFRRELIAAREEEAARIARELHDDVGQRLALVSIGLSRLRQGRDRGGPARGPDITQLQAQTSAIAESLRQIAHQLHPAALEHAGLAAALEATCEEVRQTAGLDVRIVSRGDASAIPRDVALCLFRVAQEALGNAIRHSGAHRVELSLQREPTEVRLEAADDGRGFDVGAADRGTGLGLQSALERVHAVGGGLTVASAPGAGTRMRVVVPLGRAPRRAVAPLSRAGSPSPGPLAAPRTASGTGSS